MYFTNTNVSISTYCNKLYFNNRVRQQISFKSFSFPQKFKFLESCEIQKSVEKCGKDLIAVGI